ncbi:hypothetical protein SPRG_03061 [Saprolegnia parasitica CBS 223.65]|uniref:Amino acid transporter transmembrane domain-containing protein n=1 Tax=Saprolegnia parasitica (strain CBS 223.65) TaxID=695850 RepID=A0A067D0M3_SAPPC|nr:hypothetical protein SPRG_03061 [Saprolegnia parasitica CBS 223.65]KDO32587.1 hypothetical protein SPRG_03061 [Saprolegnia parasitica CBS 223.65]|eukprot:XP_012197032.1 hypothetical protein SPRG_03061 [Saprolegnia parasitica CBS 223.65]
MEKDALRRTNSDPGRLAASLAPVPPVDFADATDFRRLYHYSGSTPKVSAPVRATIAQTLATIYDPFISAVLSLDDASFEEMDVAARVEHLLQASYFTDELTPLAPKIETKETTLTHAFLSLLKSFVGTGILFLPQGFQRGGVIFAPILLTAIAIVTVFAMLRLLACRARIGGSYSHIGSVVLGPVGHRLVQTSLVLMQFGFCCSYIIFVAQNLRDVSVYFETPISLTSLILLQTLVYIPLSWIRYMRYFTLSNLVADVFVLYAIVYIMYTNGRMLAANGIAEPLEGFNTSDYSIFLGTAVFVFEGIGLIIPTQAALAPNLQPQFPSLLAKTIAGCVVFFSLFASVNYAAIGNAVQPMILSSLPRTPQTMAVQAGYAFAQTLAYPLFLFPALQIVEDVLGFQRRSSGLKAQKMLCGRSWFSPRSPSRTLVKRIWTFSCRLWAPFAARHWANKALDYGTIGIGLFIFFFVTWTNVVQWYLGSA